jgi:hypothetical protein
VAERLPGRIGKQCRERWFNHLDRTIQKIDWTEEENQQLYDLQCLHGNKWSTIAKAMAGRTENGTKNRFNSSSYRKWAAAKNYVLDGVCIRKKKSSITTASSTTNAGAPATNITTAAKAMAAAAATQQQQQQLAFQQQQQQRLHQQHQHQQQLPQQQQQLVDEIGALQAPS